MKLVTSLRRTAIVAVCAVAPGVALAQGSVTTEQLMSLIQEQQRQINELKAQLGKVKGTAEAASAQAATASEKAAKTDFMRAVQIGGVIEMEATNSEAFSGTDSSDITIAKVEVYADAKPFEYVSTHVQLLHEDGASQDIVLDEAYATLGDTEKFPLFLTAGKWAMPFGGEFATDMSTDPLTKNIGEVKEAAVLVGAAFQGFTVETYVYNGDTKKQGESEMINQFGVNVGYGREFTSGSFSIAGGYINNIADSDGLTTGLGASASLLKDYVAGGELHGAVTYKGFTLRGAYLAALDSFQAGQLAFNGSGAKPEAWAVEFVYGTEVFGRGLTLAATMQGTEESLALGLPEKRYGVAATIEVFPSAAVTAEYLHDEDYGTAEGGTGNSGHTGTLKLAVEF
jgi:hypothetical protein